MGTNTPRVSLGLFYTKYTEYKKSVEHANAGGTIQREVVSMAELIPSHVQKGFARVYHASRTITPTQLVVAVESHAGHGEGAEVELSAASAVVARVPSMLRRRRWRRGCRQQQLRARQHSSKSAGSSAKRECYRCGQRGHIARNCMAPSPLASGGEQGHSSAARQQRLPHKGKNQRHRAAPADHQQQRRARHLPLHRG